jgi:septal ring factor EnvC (AmiA/AmiB activator)
MDGFVDVKLLITLGGVGASIIGTAAVAKAQIGRLTEMLKDVESRLRSADSRTDKLENTSDTQIQRVDILAGMLSPSKREEDARRSERLITSLDYIDKDLRRRIEHLEKIHNSKHPHVKE